MSTYTCVYTALATNVSAVSLAAALAAIPRDFTTEQVLGLSLSSDHTTEPTSNVVERTIVYTSDATGLIPPGAPMASVLQNFYSSTFGRGLGTPVAAAPVAVS
jgi:hypothetical protein